MDVNGDLTRVAYYNACVLRSCLLGLVGTPIFTNKSVTYVEVIYLRYFINLERTHKYNWKISFLVHFYSKLAYGSIMEDSKLDWKHLSIYD